MSPSLRALLAGILDYAGMFPPAKLPLDQSIRNYAGYRQGPDSWMLSRFICPASRLPDLGPFVKELVAEGPPFLISALGSGGKTTPELLKSCRKDLDAIHVFRDRHEGQADVDAYEVRLPSDLFSAEKNQEFRAAVFGPDAVFASPDALTLAIYFELEYTTRWSAALGLLLESLVENSVRRKGFKLRCGGLEASAIPSIQDVAFALAACQASKIPLKFTAGLHHPFRRFDKSLKAPTHGFINVFAAGVLAHACLLNEQEIGAILQDENPGEFIFNKEGLNWGDFRASLAMISEARQCGVLSFGSCSFDEPREDLRALGWL